MSDKRWINLLIRVGLSLGLLYCIYLVTTRAIALWYFRQPPPAGARKAIEWDPDNPAYYAGLARILERSPEGADLNEVIRLYERATELSPQRARYWADLGGAYELVGRNEDAQRAYERGQELFPNSPDINWRLANFYLRAGQTEETLEPLQKALLGDPRLRQAAFDLVWRAGVDPVQIRERMLPPDAGIFFQYISYLIRREHLDEAEQAWARLLALELPFQPEWAYPYLDALIRNKRVDQLTIAWSEIAQRNPMLIRRPATGLITNGDFESRILNGGLDWRVIPVEGVVVSVDNLTFFDGSHSLKLHFDGKQNVSYRHVHQYVPVKPNTLYRFMGYVRAQEITTDSGPRFQVQDAYNSSKLYFSTENLLGTFSWSLQQGEFQTGPETRLLVVRVVRPPSRKFDNQIGGVVWIDRISLNAVE